jgi:hypothetical protein
VLTGTNGSDTLLGGAGADLITGLGRGDTLTGGGGADRFVYTRVADSTGRNFDTITDLDASADVLDLWFQVTGIDATINGGLASGRRIELDLASVVSANKLAPYHAVLFKPDAGMLAGSTLLIVDSNGTAGYQGSADLVILLGSGSSLGGLTTGDFV